MVMDLKVWEGSSGGQTVVWLCGSDQRGTLSFWTMPLVVRGGAKQETVPLTLGSEEQWF